MLDSGDADVAFVFTTDGDLASGKYVILDDDKKFFPPYNVTFTIRNEALETHRPRRPEGHRDVQKPLTEKVMQELNARVDVDKQKPEEVATAYLESAGFIPKLASRSATRARATPGPARLALRRMPRSASCTPPRARPRARAPGDAGYDLRAWSRSRWPRASGRWCRPAWRSRCRRARRGSSCRAPAWRREHGLSVVNGPGLIDPTYRGEVKVVLVNLGAGALRGRGRRPDRPAAARPLPDARGAHGRRAAAERRRPRRRPASAPPAASRRARRR